MPEVSITPSNKEKSARPFLKWVGGKTQLFSRISELLPKTIKTYYEPFVGGGAVFWNLAAQGRFERAVLSDFNEELVTTYKAIQSNPEELIAELKKYQYEKAFFEEMRKKKLSSLEYINVAARMIYLNKTCFNGLYRVNKKGGFNSPFGRYTNPTICDEENLRACHKVLQSTKLWCRSFEAVALDAEPGDTVYFDPPYIPLSKTANFTSYQAGGFGLKEQENLARVFRGLAESGVHVVLSNSDTPTTREIYAGWEIHTVPAKRNINSKATSRGVVNEVLVVGRKG